MDFFNFFLSFYLKSQCKCHEKHKFFRFTKEIGMWKWKLNLLSSLCANNLRMVTEISLYFANVNI